MSDSVFSLKRLFSTAAVALVIDMLLVFPISHTSIIGSFVTSVSGGVVVPPLDWVATNIFGMEAPGAGFAAGGGIDIADIGSPSEGINPDVMEENLQMEDDWLGAAHDTESYRFSDYVPGQGNPLGMAA